MAIGIFSKIKQLVQKVRKGLQWANDNVYKPFIKPFAKPILGVQGPVGQTIGKGLDAASSFLDYGYGKSNDGSPQNDETTQSFSYYTIKPKSCGTYISMREIDEIIGNQTAVPYTIPIRFRVSIPLDDFLIFSAFTDYPNGIFSGCTAELITGLHAELLTDSGLKNLVTANMARYKATDACLNRVRQFYSQRPFVVAAQRVEVWPFPTSATLTGIQTSQNIPLSHVTDFCLLFPKDARATTCIENPCYQNMQVTTCGRNFPDMSMNTFDQQFFQLQLNASILDPIFEANDEFEHILTTPRNTATRRLNCHNDLTSFLITFQCERNSNGALTFDGLDIQNQNTSFKLGRAPIYQGATDSYYNVDTS
ncbi:MAG: hypothetical protein EZS28_000287 [Streblomastix strix]|uniref:Uncharacterized protein n=1 Tax=Streblomastix strix TaxID=222440 RepID=A0A5J4XA92_9EUKA|nr:MAG: hypothetical protein EZS28_000287 [Streblomastix strix]